MFYFLVWQRGFWVHFSFLKSCQNKNSAKVRFIAATKKKHFWLGVPFLLILGRLVLVLVLVALSYGFQYAVENTSNIWAPAFEVAFSLGFREMRVGKIAHTKQNTNSLTWKSQSIKIQIQSRNKLENLSYGIPRSKWHFPRALRREELEKLEIQNDKIQKY